MKKEWTLGRRNPLSVEVEIAKAVQDSRLPEAVRTLRKVDTRKAVLLAGGTVLALSALSAAGKFTAYRAAVAGELKRQLTPIRRQLEQIQTENRQLRAELERLQREKNEENEK